MGILLTLLLACGLGLVGKSAYEFHQENFETATQYVMWGIGLIFLSSALTFFLPSKNQESEKPQPQSSEIQTSF